MEKYRPWERTARCARIYSRIRTSHQERTEGKSNTTSIDSGTYIPSGKGIGYPSKIFTNPRYLQNGIESNTDNEKWSRTISVRFKTSLMIEMKISLISLKQRMLLAKIIKVKICYHQIGVMKRISGMEKLAVGQRYNPRFFPSIHLQVGEAGEIRKASLEVQLAIKSQMKINT